LTLLDGNRRTFDLYGQVLARDDPRAAWELWRATRDELFATHEQSPLPPERRAAKTAIPFFDYDPAMRFAVELVQAEPETYEIASSRDGTYSFTRFARAPLHIAGQAVGLEVYWLE